MNCLRGLPGGKSLRVRSEAIGTCSSILKTARRVQEVTVAGLYGGFASWQSVGFIGVGADAAEGSKRVAVRHGLCDATGFADNAVPAAAADVPRRITC